MLSRVQVVSGRVWLALYVKIVQVRGIEVAVIRNDRAQELINFFTRNDHYDQVRWNTIPEWKEIVAMSLVLATGRPVAQPSREFPDQCLSDGSDVDGRSMNPIHPSSILRKVKLGPPNRHI